MADGGYFRGGNRRGNSGGNGLIMETAEIAEREKNSDFDSLYSKAAQPTPHPTFHDIDGRGGRPLPTTHRFSGFHGQPCAARETWQIGQPRGSCQFHREVVPKSLNPGGSERGHWPIKVWIPSVEWGDPVWWSKTCRENALTVHDTGSLIRA